LQERLVNKNTPDARFKSVSIDVLSQNSDFGGDRVGEQSATDAPPLASKPSSVCRFVSHLMDALAKGNECA
jgi:hypothetical protein